MELSTARPNEITSNVLHSSLFPGYQEPQTPHLSSTPPKVISATNSVKEEPWTDFVKGFARGLPKGSVDSIKEIPSTVANAVETAGYVAFSFIPNCS